MAETELELRRRLGVPDDAERVIVFAESSHWDPNWLLTSTEYYKLRVQKTIDRALHQLEAEPGRVFSLECVFFLKMYWDRRPDRRDRLRELVNSGRLRLTGCGVTTPDTLIPDDEAILRDYLIGYRWLQDHGLNVAPRLAYLPDDFGHSPALPSLLLALGLEQTAFARIDGMFFPGADYRPKADFPRPGSSAELLLRDHRTLDFVWRGPDGAEVLAHWMAYSYFQGDMIAHRGPIRWMGLNLGLPARGEAAVAKKIDRFIAELAPYARSPYLFCPIGCDFVDPIPGLAQLLHRYNRGRYLETGTWAVLAGLEDYLDLVGHHRDRLPTLELDPNPYWMGFYVSRPEVKQCLRRLAKDLVAIERLLVSAGQKGAAPPPDLVADLKELWMAAAVGNHHDYITGTASERVWRKEQRPWLIAAQAKLDSAWAAAAKLAPPPPKTKPAAPLEWGLAHGRLTVASNFYQLELDERAGGCVTAWTDFISGGPAIAAPSADLLLREDSGGLWRMGHEFAGGTFRELERARDAPAALAAREEAGVLVVEVRSRLEGRPIVRRFWFRGDSPAVRMRVTGSLRARRTTTVRFSANLRPLHLVTDVPGGVVSRPLEKIYSPTFWPLKSFAHLRDQDSGRGLAVFLPGPAAFAATAAGVAEWPVMRNAPQERAFRVIPLLAHPARGPVRGEQSLDFALRFTPQGDWKGNQLHLGADKFLADPWITPGAPHLGNLPDIILIADNEEVVVRAVKPAEVGPGVIVRLHNHHAVGGVARLKFRDRKIKAASLCDSLERDLAELPLDPEGAAAVPLQAHIITVRVI